MKKFNKRVLAAVFAGVLAVSSVIPAFAEETSSVVLAYENDFDSADGLTLNGDAAIVANPDDATDSVLVIDTNGGGSYDNYASFDASILSSYDFSEGFTITMDIRPQAQIGNAALGADWNMLFGIGTTAYTDGSWEILQGSTGFIAQAWGTDYYTGYFPDWYIGTDGVTGGWQSTYQTDIAYNYFSDGGNATSDIWYNVAYVFGTEAIDIYIDGILVVEYKLVENDATNISAILSKLADVASVCDFYIGCGVSAQNFGGYIDDVRIYASALTATEVADVSTDLYTSDTYNSAFTLSVTNTQETTLDDETTADAIGVAAGGTKTIALGISNSVSSTIKNITYVYTSADETVATVDADGVISGVSNGETTITVTAYGVDSEGNAVEVAKTTVTIKVTDPNAVTGLSAGLSSVTLAVGSTATVSPTALGEKTTSVITDDYSFTYASSNTSVATVADGVITAVAEGTATITVSVVVDGKVVASTEIAVTVTAAATAGTTVPETTEAVTETTTVAETTTTAATATGTDPETTTTAKTSENTSDTFAWSYVILLAGAAAAAVVIAKKKVTE